MKITFIDHSGFMVELEETALLFDYIGGKLPEIVSDKELYVFSSHRHHDHYSPTIFDSEINDLQPTYILSDDIPHNMVPKKFQKQVLFVGANQAEKIKDKLKLHTYLSTDEGVAFIVEVEGQTIYHAGDLNNWYWEGESDQWNRTVEEKYLVELEKMRDFDIDVAFLVLDPRQEEARYLGIDQFNQIVGAKSVVPMHFWGDFTVIDQLRDREQSKSYKDKILKITMKEQVLEIKNNI